ncbi:MAG: hypothetical protein RIB60_05785 [Phycisphaerales bacterium]
MSKPSTSGRRTRTPLWALALFGSLAGILLHSKLKLTTTMPRSAYAVPEEPEGGSDSPGAVEGATSEKRDEDAGETPDGPDAPSEG